MGIKSINVPKIPNEFKKKQLRTKAQKRKDESGLICPLCRSKKSKEVSTDKPSFTPPIYGPGGKIQKTYVCSKCSAVFSHGE